MGDPIKFSVDAVFFDILEERLGFKICTSLRKILQFNYYNNAKTLSKLNEQSIAEIEETMRYHFTVDMIGPDEHIEDYLCRFSRHQTNFKLIGGQKEIINEMVEYCRKVYNESSPPSNDSELQNTFIYQPEFLEKSSRTFSNIIGSHMITVYNDAKRMTLSAWSWPSRYVAHEIGEHFKAEGFPPREFTLQYVTPVNHEAFLDSIVKSDFANIILRISQSLALSIRLDGSTDRTQEHNVYVMVQIVNKDATVSTLFLGFAVPECGDGTEYLKCLKTVTKDIIEWKDLFPLASSAVTDGEYLNSGHISGLCTRLQQERTQSSAGRKLPFFWIWCIAHRVNLAWTATSKLNIVTSAIQLCRDLCTHFHKSGARTLKPQQIAAENNLHAPLRYPKYFPVRWVENVHSLFTSVLRNWRASIKYFQRENLTQLLRQWLNYSRIHFIAFLTDILGLVKNFQKICQSDSISILEIQPIQRKLFDQLNSSKNQCIEGGWEELFRQNTIHSGEKIYFYGFELQQTVYNARRRRNAGSCLKFTDKQRNYLIDSLVGKLKIRLALDSSLCQTLEPLNKILLSTTRAELNTCHSFIIPDLNETQFYEEYFVAAEALKYYECKSPLDTLQKLNDYHPDQLTTVKTALARIAAAKPNSADVERLIHKYNTLKDDDRASLSAKTLYNYLYVNTNMPPVANFDPTAAINHWMSLKNRQPRTSLKSKEQEWFKGVFEEASAKKIVERRPKIQF